MSFVQNFDVKSIFLMSKYKKIRNIFLEKSIFYIHLEKKN